VSSAEKEKLYRIVGGSRTSYALKHWAQLIYMTISSFAAPLLYYKGADSLEVNGTLAGSVPLHSTIQIALAAMGKVPCAKDLHIPLHRQAASHRPAI
jgi:hypothetical protein